MKAIQTTYRGYRFRSRVEARYAVFFDALGLKWEYEKQGYALPSGPYLPDFWIREMDCWVEIKGEEPTSREKRLAQELSEEHKTCVLFHGVPMENPGSAFLFDSTDSGGGEGWWDEIRWAVNGAAEVCFTTGNTWSSRTYGHANECQNLPRMVQAFECQIDHPRLYLARLDAIGARFEHGEKPRV